MKKVCSFGLGWFGVLGALVIALWAAGLCPWSTAALVLTGCALGLAVCIRELRWLRRCEMREREAARRSAWRADMFRQISEI